MLNAGWILDKEEHYKRLKENAVFNFFRKKVNGIIKTRNC